MISKEEREIFEGIVREYADKRDLKKELQKYLDTLLEQIIAEEGRSHESTT